MHLRLQRRSLRILHALINPHDLLARCFGSADEVSEEVDGGRIEVMHHSNISTGSKISLERLQLHPRRLGLAPPPVFDIDAPVDNIRVIAEPVGSQLTHAGSSSTERRSKIFG